MATRWARVLRGLLAGIVATSAAAASHALAGGTISGVGLALSATFATVTCIALTGQRMSIVRLAASVVLSQLAFHLLFGLVGTGATVVGTGHHAMLVTSVSEGSHLAAWMWLGHAAAATVTLLALNFGERAFWRLGELLFVRLHLSFVLDPVSAPPLPVVDALEIPRLRLERSFLLYRGPPVASVA